MNEFIFIIHVFMILAFGLGALRLGKEALSCFVIIQAILANLFVIKQITLFHLEVTCSDLFAIGCLLGLNLLREYFGKESATKVCWITFFSLFFFALMAKMHLYYLPNIHDISQSSFQTILSPTPRLLFASLATFAIVQQIDLHLFSKLKTKLPSFPLRSALSISLSQLLDTLLFSFLGLYGIVHSIFDIIVMSFLLKLFIIFCMTPFTSFARRCLPSR